MTIKNTTIYDASISNFNMLLYLDAANPASYPGSGTTWYDISGNNNNTTNTGGTTYNSNNGGYFNFSSGYFTTLSSKYNVPFTGKTMFFAANLTSIGGNTFRNIFGCNAGSRNFNVYMYYTGSAYQLHYSAAGLGGFSNNLTYTVGNWFTCGVTQTTDGLVTYYFNGRPVGTNNFAFSQYLNNTYEQVGASDNYWYGPISVACIYKAALTSDQMLQNHNAIKSRYGL